MNRLFIVGVLTEKEDVGVEVEYWRILGRAKIMRVK